MKFKGYLFAIISAAFYGLIPLFIIPLKQLHYPLNTSLFYRFLISAFILSLYLLYSKTSLKLNSRELLILVLIGLCYALSTDFLMLGYEYISPGIASTILYAFPIIVAFIMTTFFKEKISRSTIISLIITSLGIVILGIKNDRFEINTLGIGVSLLSALFYALYLVAVNKSNLSISGFKLTFYSLLFSSCYYGIKMLISGNSLEIPSATIFINLLLLSLIATVLSIVTLVYAIKLIGATSTSILGAFEPIVAVFISVFLFGEHITLSLIIGVSLIISGVIQNILSSK